MRRLFYHVVTSLVPELLGKDALLNETVAEIERRALEEAERTSPRYARCRFLRGFRVFLRGRRVVYGLEWVTVSLPVLYR
jgi:putative transposase